jgi:TonB family protein
LESFFFPKQGTVVFLSLWRPCWRANIRRSSANVALALALVASMFCLPMLAQSSGKNGRKVVAFTKPEYPQVLKVAQVGGTVRLSATVLPNGTVTKVEVRGGNPILAESAVAAVMKWKYAPSASQTTEEISLSFSPR